MKMDLQKAFNKVNWKFLRALLTKFGFNKIFVKWIMECVSTVSSSVLINREKMQFFKPTRGLRQGDPLSLYLFIMCQEVLSRMIEKEYIERGIKGVKMNIGGSSITHAMYVDDLMLFSKANRRQVMAINECLERYCRW